MNDYKTLREQAYEGNMEIPKRGLAIYTWGNVSAYDKAAGVFAIKPSGVSYEALNPDSMVVIDLEGKNVMGKLKPSTDTETHRCLYQAFAGIGGITHTHSAFATAWAQAGQNIPVLGTTHADHSAEEIPCTAFLSETAVQNAYEWETGKLIIETFKMLKKNPLHMQMVLVAGHGPFTWGTDAAKSVYHAAVLEEICKIACYTLQINPGVAELPAHIINKHWERKHGPQAYYGQNTNL
jgi:L-ribulose-5-phosphate 4-epimerase